MGIAFLTLAEIFTPLQSLASRWMPARRRSGLRYVSVRPGCTVRAAGGKPTAVSKPLRVVRVLDAQRTTSGAGRVVISGRMADVCAELDRLAALEAADDARRLMH